MIHPVQITKWLEEEGVQSCDVEIVCGHRIGITTLSTKHRFTEC